MNSKKIVIGLTFLTLATILFVAPVQKAEACTSAIDCQIEALQKQIDGLLAALKLLQEQPRYTAVASGNLVPTVAITANDLYGPIRTFAPGTDVTVAYTSANTSSCTLYTWTETRTGLATSGTIFIPNIQKSNNFYVVCLSALDGGATTVRTDITVDVLPASMAAMPALSIIYPNGTEFLRVGQAANITWNFANSAAPITKGTAIGDTLDIWLMDSTNPYNTIKTPIAMNLSGNTTSYLWNIPLDFPLGSHYRIYIVASRGTMGINGDVSDSGFSITLPVAQAPQAPATVQITTPINQTLVQAPVVAPVPVVSAQSITVTSPNGGELVAGQNATVTWNSLGLLPTDIISVWMQDSSNPYSTTRNLLSMSIINGDATSYNWAVPANFAAGSKYKIVVEAIRNGLPLTGDSSDNFVSVR